MVDGRDTAGLRAALEMVRELEAAGEETLWAESVGAVVVCTDPDSRTPHVVGTWTGPTARAEATEYAEEWARELNVGLEDSVPFDVRARPLAPPDIATLFRPR